MLAIVTGDDGLIAIEQLLTAVNLLFKAIIYCKQSNWKLLTISFFVYSPNISATVQTTVTIGPFSLHFEGKKCVYVWTIQKLFYFFYILFY